MTRHRNADFRRRRDRYVRLLKGVQPMPSVDVKAVTARPDQRRPATGVVPADPRYCTAAPVCRAMNCSPFGLTSKIAIAASAVRPARTISPAFA